MEYLGNIRRTMQLWSEDSSTIGAPLQSSVSAFDRGLSHLSDSVSSSLSEAGSSISNAIDEIVNHGEEAITEAKRYMFINTGERQRIRNSRREIYRKLYSNQDFQNDAVDHAHTTNHGMEKMARTVDITRHMYDAKPSALVEDCAISKSQSCPNVIPTIVLSSCDQMEHWLFDHDISSSEEMYDIFWKIDVAIEYSVASRELKVTIESVESNTEPSSKQKSVPMFMQVCSMPQNGRKQKHSKTMKRSKLLNCNEDIYLQNISFDSARLLCLRFQLCKKKSIFARKRHQYVGETFVWLSPNDLEQRVKLSKLLHNML